MFKSIQARTAVYSKSILIAVLISLITTIMIMLLSSSGFFQNYELKSLDFFQRFNAPVEDAEVLMVEIDQKSLTALSEQGIQWPWPRQMYVPLIELCANAGARAIIFDIILSEPSSYGKQDDLELAQAIQRAQNVFLPMNLSAKEAYRTNVSAIKRFGFQEKVPEFLFREAKSYIRPVEELVEGTKGLGDVIISPDRDGVYRKIPLFTRFRDYLFPSLAVAPVMDKFSFSGKSIFFDGDLLFTSNRGELFLHFYGKAFQFPKLNALEMISAFQNPDSPLFNKVVSQIRDRFIIIGLTAPGLYDLKPTAVTSISPGAYIHGTLLTDLLKGDHIREINETWRFASIFVLGIILALSILRIISFWKNSTIFVLFLMGWPVICLMLFYYHQRWMGFLGYEVAFFIVFGLTSTYSYHTEGRKRRTIRRLFSHYMSEVLVKELEAKPEKATLGGERQFITIFFSDLANFTSLSEKFEPERVVSLLNDYFTEMSQIIIDSQGVIDKYQGDGIMAFWGAPIPLQNHALMACLAALKCLQGMEKINHKLRNDGMPDLTMRIGLHSGEAIVGNMGSMQRFDYTIVGDNVNLASRLEGANKQFGTKIIVSETTYHLAKDRIEARELDLIAVKGKEEPIRIFELLGEKVNIAENLKRIKFLFEEGLISYRKRDFEGALRQFEKVLEISPDDQPGNVFFERCRDLIENVPPTDWDGVFRLKEK